eukprot:7129952-Prymnesium_polylepis.1
MGTWSWSLFGIDMPSFRAGHEAGKTQRLYGLGEPHESTRSWRARWRLDQSAVEPRCSSAVWVDLDQQVALASVPLLCAGDGRVVALDPR